jgi:hypothetical protein
MSTGPLHRLAGALGLLALAPTAVLLAGGLITPADAALRAVVTLAGVLVLARIARWWVSVVLARFEREAEAAKPRRRAEDTPAGATRPA